MKRNNKKQTGALSGIKIPRLRRTSRSDISALKLRGTSYYGISTLRLRRAAFALCACLLFSAVLGGCGTGAAEEPVDLDKLQVMASFYTMYDFAQKIGGEHVQVTCMVPSGTEPHDWEPSTKDIIRLEQADVFIYNGAGMEHWVSDVVAGLSNRKLISVEASQGVSLLRSADAEDSHDHAVAAAPDGHDAHEHGEYDPHVWLDPMNAKQEMQNICEAFSEADPEHSADYQANYEKWAKKLDDLDATYQTTLETMSDRDIVVAHEAYGYLCRRYGLTQVSIEGMSPDSEPDPGRMADIIDFVRENNVRAIFFEELSGSRTAETVAAETGVKLLTLSPLEGLSDRQEETGGDYFSVMEENLQQLTEALQ